MGLNLPFLTRPGGASHSFSRLPLYSCWLEASIIQFVYVVFDSTQWMNFEHDSTWKKCGVSMCWRVPQNPANPQPVINLII
jgi:hypothetical protein